MTMVTISVRSLGAVAAGTAVVEALAPIGSSYAVQRRMYSTDWYLDYGTDRKPDRLEALSEVVQQVSLLLRDAAERGLHVTYRGQSGPVHEFWPPSGLPVVTVT